MLRPCEVWAQASDPSQREADIKRYGHSVHECANEREFAAEHEGNHKCECGFEWPHQVTDNDPVPKPAEETEELEHMNDMFLFGDPPPGE